MDEWAIVIASGPSFRVKDAQALRGAGKIIAINCAVFYVPWADVLFAGDGVWWRHYGPKITWFKGKRVSKTALMPGIERWHGKGWARTGGNSGHMGIQHTVDEGHKNIVLLGFDQQIPKEGENKNKIHCHGDHPIVDSKKRTNLGNGDGIKAWPRAMAATANDLKRRGVRVVNLSRETALVCFERMTVEEFLGAMHG